MHFLSRKKETEVAVMSGVNPGVANPLLRPYVNGVK